jgi:hypothetical protein
MLRAVIYCLPLIETPRIAFDNANLITGRNLLLLLKEWWCNYIQQEDKKYVPYLAAPVEA